MDLEKYSRQTSLPGFDQARQRRLLSARVLVVGSGALGTVASLYMAGAGVGHITLADFDTVSESNLHRQVAFAQGQCGMYKAEVLAQRLRALNSDIQATALCKRVEPADIQASKYDLVMDCADNSQATFMIDRACAQQRIDCIIGGVYAWGGQVIAILADGQCPRWADITVEPNDPPAKTPNPVFGPVPGVLGSVMAAEAIKLLSGIGTNLAGRFFTYTTEPK